MGFLDGLRFMKALAEESAARTPRWARVLKVGRKVGPVTGVELEVHYGGQPPFQVSTQQWIPRGVTLEAGQDVAVKRATGDSHDTWFIEWGEPPHYGDG